MNSQKFEFITLSEKPEHINPYLTHWTGNKKCDEEAFKILSLIINGKRLKFSLNENGYNNEFSSEMICFTDTPISQSYNHCEIYNSFGISFNKEDMIAKGANPVFYLVPNRQCHQDFLGNLRFEGKVNLLNNEEHDKFSWVQSIFQAYDTKKYISPEFKEREWRVVRILPSNSTKTALKYCGDFNDGFDINEIEHEKLNNEERFYLKLDNIKIENIIVPLTYKNKVQELININNLDCKLYIIENPPSSSKCSIVL